MYALNSNPSSDLQSSDISKGVVGLTIDLAVYEKNVPRDISTATGMKFAFQRPDGTTFERDAIFSNDGKDGRLNYVTNSGDLDQAGKWRVQAFIVLGTFSGHSSITEFYVNDTLK